VREAVKTGGQIVIDHDLVTGTPESTGDMAADIPRSSNDKNRHVVIILRRHARIQR
jgi:hypothetical protein